MPAYPITTQDNWGDRVTPQKLRKSPIHRWLVFPHSFTDDLISDLSHKWGLNQNDLILDPFVGAGTTLVAANAIGIPSFGYDLSPFSVFVTRVKTASYDCRQLQNCWASISKELDKGKYSEPLERYPDLIRKAFAPDMLRAFEKAERAIYRNASSAEERDFFKLALLAIIPRISRAKATGGWLKWVEMEPSFADFHRALVHQVDMMLEDVGTGATHKVETRSRVADARFLPDSKSQFSAIITSPPYPNRHDYTRVFGIELMYGFLDSEQTKALRYQSIHSHPEAKPNRPDVHYVPPGRLVRSLKKIQNSAPGRIQRMLEGYFLDLACCFKEMKRVAQPKANIAVVLGNAQYYGEPLLVDEIAAEIGEQAGLTCREIIAARMRGNSAQQMKKYGRNPSRESVIIFCN